MNRRGLFKAILGVAAGASLANRANLRYPMPTLPTLNWATKAGESGGMAQGPEVFRQTLQIIPTKSYSRSGGFHAWQSHLHSERFADWYFDRELPADNTHLWWPL